MPNWCFTSYVAIGDENEVKDLYKTMKSLEKRTASLVPNGFGKTWLGNLVTALGANSNNVSCRGYWQDLEICDNELRFCTESAWSDPHEVIDFVKQKFPSIEFYYCAEEPGCRYFATNDKDGLYFQARYTLYIPSKSHEYEYDESQERQFLDDVSECIGIRISSINDVEAAVDEYNEDKDWDEHVEVKIFSLEC